MKADAHIYLSLNPLRAGQNVATKCGALVEKCQIVQSWDSLPVNKDIEWPRGICAKCILAMEHHKRGPEFVYAVSNRVDRREQGE